MYFGVETNVLLAVSPFVVVPMATLNRRRQPFYGHTPNFFYSIEYKSVIFLKKRADPVGEGSPPHPKSLIIKWWPGTDLVPLPPLTARKLLFLRRARSARTPRPASFWHTIGTLLISRWLRVIARDPRFFKSHSVQTAIADIYARA